MLERPFCRGLGRVAAVLAALFLVTPAASAKAGEPEIPSAALREALREHFPSWKTTRCLAVEATAALWKVAYIEANGGFPPGTRVRKVPCRVFGDFDGDGTRDAAVQMERSDRSSDRQIVVVVFRREGALVPVYAGDGADILGVAKKGTRDWDYVTESHVRYATDAIYVGEDERGGGSLVYRRGRFITFLTSD